MKKIIYTSLVAAFILMSIPANAQVVNIINLFAGDNNAGYSGDGGLAVNAEVSNPADVALDTAGNLYIADFYNNVIRIVNKAGIIGTYAGTGFGAGTSDAGAYTGDGGPATAAELNGPYGLATDRKGNLYFADGYNHVVRKINAAGIISTFAGDGTIGYAGNGGPATSAKIDNPVGIAIDAMGNVFIADDHNHVIRKVDTGGIISTYAGNNTLGNGGDGGPATNAALNLPIGVAFDALGNLYIADENNNNVRKVTTAGIISTFVAVDTAHGYSGDGGPATAAQLSSPCHIAVGNTSNLFISDETNNLVRVVDLESGVINTFAGMYYGSDDSGTLGAESGDGGPATAAQLWIPDGIAVGDSGKIYIADRANQVIRIVQPVNVTGIKPLNTAGVVLSVNPNPARDGAFTVTLLTGNKTDVSYSVSNVLGETIKTITGTTNQPVSLRLDSPPGIYFISAVTRYGKWVQQVCVD